MKVRSEDDTGHRQFMMPSHSISFCFHPVWSKSSAVSVGDRLQCSNFFCPSNLHKVGCHLLLTQLHVPCVGCCRTFSRNALNSSGLSNHRSRHLSTGGLLEYLNLMVHVTWTLYLWCWWTASWRLFPVRARAPSLVTMGAAPFVFRLRHVLEKVLPCPAISKNDCRCTYDICLMRESGTSYF